MPMRTGKRGKRLSAPERDADLPGVPDAAHPRDPDPPAVLSAIPEPPAPAPPPAFVWLRMGTSLSPYPAPLEDRQYLFRIGEDMYHHIGEHTDGRWIYANVKG